MEVHVTTNLLQLDSSLRVSRKRNVQLEPEDPMSEQNSMSNINTASVLTQDSTVALYLITKRINA